MNLKRFQAAADFRARAEAFLVAHEAEHNLPLGLTSALMVKPDLYPGQPYFAVVEAGGATVAAAVMTPPYNLIVSRTEAHEALALVAQDVQAVHPTLPGVVGPVPVSLHFAEIWRNLTGHPYRKRMAERIYQLSKVNRVTGVPGRMRRATEPDRSLLAGWLAAFQQGAFGETDPSAVERIVSNILTMPPETRGMYFWEDPHPVSMAGYGGPTPNGIRIGPVYTPPEQRRKGYASACVAALSRLMLDRGRKYCFLFTDLANPTSNHIYQQIGYEPVCDVDEYKFDG